MWLWGRLRAFYEYHGRVFKVFYHPCQELRGLRAVNDPVVEGDGKRQYLPYGYGLVLYPRLVHDSSCAEYGHIRVVYYRGCECAAERPVVAERECRAFKLVERDFSG